MWSDRLAKAALPQEWLGFKLLGLASWQILSVGCIVLAAIGFGWTVARAAQFVGMRFARRTGELSDDRFFESIGAPLRLVTTMVLVEGHLSREAWVSTKVPWAVGATHVGLVLAAAWLSLRVVAFWGDLLEERSLAKVRDGFDDLRIRSRRTQVSMLRRLATVAVISVAIALILLQFQSVRRIGLSLLASAGVAGVAIGFAAQKTLASLLAGLQLSITQPIRIGDSVIVEDDWGWIEEITLTYVVVRTWDRRRIVLPVTYFLEQPFQNWTRRTQELLGSVVLRVEQSLPIDAIRTELGRVLDSAALWDRHFFNVQVTELHANYLEVRCLVSARTAPELWDLRCMVREQLVTWLQQLEGGRFLPQTRLNLVAQAEQQASKRVA